MEREVVWFFTSTRCWTLGGVISVAGDNYVVQTTEGENLKVTKKDILPFKDFHKSDVEDLITLSETHEAPILYNLQQRFLRDKIYTYIGPVIISVNPFKDIKNSGDEILNRYLTTPVEQLPPHLYAIAHKAYHSLSTRGQSQSVIITGESGAGKTEATKIILKYLTVACGHSSSGYELSQRILATNPVLESFGNAKTVRNNNSSRFGKFISIAFDPGGSLNSASINNYLLETVRVITQAPSERNYHVFYELISGAEESEKICYKLKDSGHYRYLKNGFIRVEGVDDGKNFLKLKHSMATLGIEENEQKQLFCLLSGILQLGDIDFEGQEEAKIKDHNQLRTVASLLQVPEPLMVTALTQRFFSGGNRPSGYNIPLNNSQAVENRDALAKALYSRLFDHLVQRINKPLLGENPPIDLEVNNDPRKFIGVLDIYGFEVFEDNSLEQFCINYANEKLHSQFNQHMFKAEQAVYLKEGVSWDSIKFVDNQDCVDLIEGYNGLLAMLDEEGRIPKGADKTLLDKLIKKHSRNPRFKYRPQNPNVFGIDHYAGIVEYAVHGFLMKNKDTLNRDLISVLWSSESSFVQGLFLEEYNEYLATQKTESRFQSHPSHTGALSRPSEIGKKKITVCGRFHQSLMSLMSILSQSERHYVRCLKPNDQLRPAVYDSNKVLLQLKSNGIMETIKIRKVGYASHIPYESFYHRFNFLGIKSATKEDIELFLRKFSEDRTQWTLGTSKVFLREKAADKLEVLRRDVYVKVVVTMQSLIRTWNLKQQVVMLLQRRLLKSILAFQRYIRQWNAKRKLISFLERERDVRAAVLVAQRYVRQNYIRRKFVALLTLRTTVTMQKYIRCYNAKLLLYSLILIKIQRQQEDREQREREQREREQREREQREREQREREQREREQREREQREREQREREQREREQREREQREREQREREQREREQRDREIRERQQPQQHQQHTQQNQLQYRIEHVVVMQKYIRGWRERKQAIGLIVQKLRELREVQVGQQKEVEEWRKIVMMYNRKNNHSQKENKMIPLNVSTAQTLSCDGDSPKSSNQDTPYDPPAASYSPKQYQTRGSAAPCPDGPLSPREIPLSPRVCSSPMTSSRVGSGSPADMLLSPRDTEDERKRNMDKMNPMKPIEKTGTAKFKIPVPEKFLPNKGGFSRIQGFWAQHTQKGPPKTSHVLGKPEGVLGNGPTTPKHPSSGPNMRNTELSQQEYQNHATEGRRVKGRSRSVPNMDELAATDPEMAAVLGINPSRANLPLLDSSRGKREV